MLQKVAQIVDVAARAADSAGDEIGLRLQAQSPGPLRMAAIRNEGQGLERAAIGQARRDTGLDIGLSGLLALHEIGVDLWPGFIRDAVGCAPDRAPLGQAKDEPGPIDWLSR